MAAFIPDINGEKSGAMLHPVSPEEFAYFWPICAPMIERVIDRFKENVSATDIGKDIAASQRQLWVVVDGERIIGSIVTHIEDYHGKKSGILSYCAGEDFKRWVRSVDLIADYFKSEGCATFHMIGRKGWEKFLPEFRTDKVVLERSL